MFTDLISLNEAKEKKLNHYFTGKECKKGHISKRLVSTRSCLDCVKNHAEKYRKKTKEINGGNIFYIDEIPCQKGHISKKYSAGNVCYECYKINSKNYRINNKEKIKNRLNNFKKKYPERINADTAFRRANKKKATPAWLTKEMKKQIKDFYKTAKKLEKETGTPYHVDHVIPLNGKTVSGLHVPWNLRVIPSVENLSKSNKLMENLAWLATSDKT